MTSLPIEDNAAAEEFSAVSLLIAGEHYGVELTTVREIIKLPLITRVPRAPDYVRGVINLHGNIIPVIDLATRLNIGNTADTSTQRAVVLEVEGEVIGVLAESVSKVTRFARSQIQPPPAVISGIGIGIGIDLDLVTGVIRHDAYFVVFLDLDRTLNEHKQKADDAGQAKTH